MSSGKTSGNSFATHIRSKLNLLSFELAANRMYPSQSLPSKMDTGVLFYEIDPPYIHEDPVRAYFNPDAPYDFPLSWLHPGGPGISHPEEQMPPPPDDPPPPEPPLPNEPIPAQPIHESSLAPFVLDEWGVPVLPPELDPLPEPIEPPVFDEQ
ncbi:WW domain-containing protein C2F3.14c-like [Arachis duranensis]|uniref:WW domain-containing protein C2F3.14c-like n=1 Tax=Arachis duranensis TaxID=130453 RepID=A0A6P5MW29_ARADU|nr:WW domain-containing protein C2F3.14c-like [Arachis duranensis]